MKHRARPVRARLQAAPAVTLPADPMLAAAVLLPCLDAEAAAGHEASRLAAGLIRGLLSPALPATPGPETLAEAVQRLAAVVRAQDGQLARLEAMLERLL